MTFDVRDSARRRGDRSKDYWVQVAVRLESRLETSDGRAVSEYRVNLGVACEPEQIKDVVLSAITDGNIIWKDTEWRALDREDIVDESIRGRTNFQMERGVWYRSGRILLAE